MVLLIKKINIKTKVRTKTGVNMRFILISIFLISLLSIKLLACADSWSEIYLKNEYYNFTDPDMVDLPRDNPLYKLSGTYAAHDTRFKYFAKQKKEANIAAWKVYFQDVFSYKEIEEMFYKANSIKKSAKYYAGSSKYPSFGKYIHFLNLQNQLAQNNDQNNSYKIIKEGLKLFDEEKKPFFKERYLYLLMRLYHHNGQYHKLLELHVNNILIVNEQSVVKEWIIALVAGAYQQLKQSTNANKLYAHIFSTHKTNPHYGYYDFKINSNEEWNELLSSTENNDTKALYHFLRAMKWGNEPLHELKNIAQLAPSSVWFERLSYMIMQELQNKRHSMMVYRGRKDRYFDAKLESYRLQKKYFLAILKTLEKQTFFTLYSKFYLNVLESNSLVRNDRVDLLKLANYKQKPYAKLLNYLYGVHQLSSSSKQEQDAIYTQLKPLLPSFSKKKQASILRYTILQLSIADTGLTIEKELNKLFSQNQMHRKNILKTLNYVSASKFKNYVENKKNTFFEEEIFKETMHNLHRRDVAKILATLYLQENNFQESQFYLRQVPEQNQFTPYNPFNTSISNSNRSKSKKTYSQKKFVETMLRIESALRKNPKSAIDHFLYANGLYNKSWFGNFPMSSVLHRSPNLLKKIRLPKTTNLNQAQREYELALKYAINDEFRAKIAYQLLKIKFNIALSDTYQYDKNILEMPQFNNHGTGTKKVITLLKKSKDFSEALKDFKIDYKHTDYAQEVIKKCVTFKYF